MQADANAALVRDWVELIWNQGQLERLADFHPTPFINEGQPSSPELARQWHVRMRAAYPDLHYVIEHLLSCDGRVAFRWTATGTQRGMLWGRIPATHKAITWGGMHMLRVEAGRIAEVWAFSDMAAMLQQLGVSLQPPPTPGS